jgi:hypothetical protein
LGVALLMLVDMALKALLRPLIDFPSALIGMAAIVALFVAARRWRPALGAAAHLFFQPAVAWVAHKWLPCFYAPALVTLPLAARPLPADALLKAVAVVGAGVALTAGVTAHVALAIRRATGTEMDPVPHEHHPVTFSFGNYAAWGGVALAALGALLLGPAAVQDAAVGALLLAATLLGYMAGMALPDSVRRVLHPIVTCAAAPNAAAALAGALTGRGYWDVLQSYLVKGAVRPGVASYGPGNLLFAFLGTIILCFGFKVVEQWELLVRHAPEVLGATSASAAFSMLSTAALGRAAGLPTGEWAGGSSAAPALSRQRGRVGGARFARWA